jgi:hypothetical protein
MTLLFLALALSCDDKGDDSTPSDESDADTDADTDADADADTDSDPDPATVPLGGACPLETRYGGFLVDAAPDYTIVDGLVTDGVVPSSILETIGSEGDCVLLKRNNPFCDPTCSPDETCDFDGTCVPKPENQNIGTVTIEGLAKPVEMEARKPTNNYFDTTLPKGALPPGGLVTLQSTGGAYDPITLYGVGFDLLTAPKAPWSIAEGKPLTVAWDPPYEDDDGKVSRSEAYLKINIDQHGITPTALYCSFADDGEGTVPASLLKMLVGQGVTGFPDGSLTRRTVDSTAVGAGCAELVVSSLFDANVNVVGYTPCTTDEMCPDGQHCNEKLERCEKD